jgi:2-haloacid dehalogenase
VVFDLGNVLILWDPKKLFRTLLSSDSAIDTFFQETSFAKWNESLDAGVRFEELVPRLSSKYPHYAHLFAAYRERWEETLVGPLHGTVELLYELKQKHTPLYALTNWSAETFPHALKRFDFLSLFEGILVSGAEKLIKPDPKIFTLLLERYRLDPSHTFFTDDVEANCAGALASGLHAHRFTHPDALRAAVQAFLSP